MGVRPGTSSDAANTSSGDRADTYWIQWHTLTVMQSLSKGTAQITTAFCVWCFTSNAVGSSHGHDKSFYVTESDPRVQLSVPDATSHLWTIRKNVAGRLWYTHNSSGIKTHIKPTAAALSGYSGLPAGWEERKTPDGRTYYFNRRMGTSAWTKPANSLPDGWKELRTPDLVPFYINEKLGLSTWDRPGQQPRQQKASSGGKVIIRRPRPGQGNPGGQNAADNILSATINAARLTGQGVEIASRQVGKLGKKKNWRKMGRMMTQVSGMNDGNSGSDGGYSDNECEGGEDDGGFQEQSQQGQYQQNFDYQETGYSEQQQQQSFMPQSSQAQPMFQQSAYDQQPSYQYPTQSEQSFFEQPQQPVEYGGGQEPCQPQQSYEQQQQTQYQHNQENQQQAYEQQQQPTYEPIAPQQSMPYEPTLSAEQGNNLPPQVPQEQYMPPQHPSQQPPVVDLAPTVTQEPVYTSQQPFFYEPVTAPQSQVTVSYETYQVPADPTSSLIAQSQYAIPEYLQNNQPEIITSDVPLVEDYTDTRDNTSLYVDNNQFVSADAQQNSFLNEALVINDNVPASQGDFVVEVTIQQTSQAEIASQPGLEAFSTPEPLVVQEYGATQESVDSAQAQGDIDVSANCLALI
ncbi:hypothetical protein FZEAL_6229 [Fusarium zealandicum]|uniref:WW domain-containing protein n=1 Tax=Fusarium zealandicum TaxID=1053134 RepID=A0A8H4UI58_9HYPO|nr:hypothetical protein FZEAL_6229 [Fusarium zealandicum]